ncbi:MAG: hypothetical protein O2783_01040 [Chloroflexi bacterium]|nr:hypothetical protein [Chloroflexota bacterium]
MAAIQRQEVGGATLKRRRQDMGILLGGERDALGYGASGGWWYDL